MDTITALNITGFENHRLPNTFYRHATPPRRLAVVYPGRGYTCAMPVLFYPTHWLYEHGADVLTIEYGFSTEPTAFTRLPEEDRISWLGADARASLRAALESGKYTELVLVGKSLGTLALAHLLLNEPRASGAAFVWLTPLVSNPFLSAAILQTRPRSLFVQGTADPAYEPDAMQKLHKAAAGQLLLIPDADHILHIGGDFDAILDAIRRMLAALATFTAW